jgi:hypothetical protein
MFTSIRLQQPAGQAKGAVDLLQDCHGRIRHFTGVAVRLCEAVQPEAGQVRDAAKAVYRYYSIALPLHEEDENLSTYPRLFAAVPKGHLAQALDDMVAQHGEIDALVAELIPLWGELQEHPERLDALRAAMEPRVRRLQQLWTTHLALEEETIFPAMRQFLGADTLSEILGEMKQRRNGQSQ